MMRTKTVIAAVTITIAAFLGGCSSGEKKIEPVVTVEVAPAKRQAIDRMIAAEAVLWPLHEAAITPKVAAPVKKFLVQRGASVKEGQLLAVLENRDLAAAELQSKGDYEQAQAAYATTTSATLPEDLQKAELEVNAAKQELDANQKIFESRQSLFKEGALPRKDLDAAQVAYVQSKNQYDIALKHYQALEAVGKQQTMKSAKGQLTSAQGKYENSAAMLSYTEIRSPISGVVTDRPLYPGEMASTSTPMMTVMDLSQVIAKAHIPQQEAALLKPGDVATIAAPGMEEKIPAKVTIVSPALDPNSTTVEVWVQAANPKHELRPGSTVEVSMVAAHYPDAIVVPSSALLTAENGETSVMVVGSDGRAHQQKVTVGFRQGDDAQIAGGLQPGQQVVTKGAYGLPDNTKIQIASAEKPEGKPDEKPTAGKEDKDKDEKD